MSNDLLSCDYVHWFQINKFCLNLRRMKTIRNTKLIMDLLCLKQLSICPTAAIQFLIHFAFLTIRIQIFIQSEFSDYGIQVA